MTSSSAGMSMARVIRMVSIEIVRAFVGLRALFAGNTESSRKLAALEKKYDAQFQSRVRTPCASSWR
jgi:hypothetical protein